jgi:pimeloyl-ACP methyl ester carboxylesterase
MCAALVLLPSAAQAADHQSGRLPDGAFYSIDQPDHWNGTVLLWSHGYAPKPVGPEVPTSPPGLRAALLSRGYALVASGYAQPGWALAVAPQDQVGALSAYISRFGNPRRVIAWGASMGGLVTVELAERYAASINGALPVCGSVVGALGMMNMALDGAFAFATLAAPHAELRLVHTGDDRANGQAAVQAVQAAQATPGGRARIALAATLGGLPGWTEPATPRPQPSDTAGEEGQQAASFVLGIFLPRAGQEALAGGVFSWNTGIDYAAQLRRSGRRAYVESLYRAAHLSLDDDLTRLAAAPRIAATAGAVNYMRANYTATGALGVPMVAMHTIGDGLTSPSLERGYADLVAHSGRSALLQDLFVDRAGHCTLSVLEDRLDTGAWHRREPPPETTRFLEYEPTEFLRP